MEKEGHTTAAPEGSPEAAGRGRALAARLGHGPGGRLTTRQKVVPPVFLAVFLACLVYAMLPFELLGGDLRCGPAILGSDPKGVEPGSLARPERDCRNSGNSRLAFAGVLGTAALVIAAAGLVLPPDPEEG